MQKQVPKKDSEPDVWSRLLLLLTILLPLAVLFFLPGGTLFAGGPWLWLLLLLSVWLAWWILGLPSDAAREPSELHSHPLAAEQQPAVVREVMEVNIAVEEAGARIFRGRLREPAASVYEKLKMSLPAETSIHLREDEDTGASIALVPGPAEEEIQNRPIRAWTHWLLFGLTLVTTTWAGAAHQGVNLLHEPGRFATGLPYSLGLLAILGVHELGHYFAARRHGMHVTPPYFIPVPFALGTFGAFIQMRSPAENRRMLFDVAVAGPLAGLAVAIPALLVGLQSSQVFVGKSAMFPGALGGGTSVGSSFLFALLSKLALGEALDYGHVLRLSPLGFAGWLGLLITALNLLPIGQLDGGHMASAMFGGRTGATISSVAMWSLFLLAIFVWPGLMMWAIIVFFLAGRGASPLNDLTTLSPGRCRVGYATFVILALILLPFPHGLWTSAGIHCPYL
ncbi:MAG: site-2 protease family protein [Bryobacteraceae bacterium]